MRPLPILLLAVCLCSPGCSCYLAEMGSYPPTCETKEQARVVFGNPTATGSINDNSYDEFTYRRKIPEDSMGLGYVFMGTLGLGEVVMLPMELFSAVSAITVGNNIRLTYDDSGRVIEATLNGTTRLW